MNTSYHLRNATLMLCTCLLFAIVGCDKDEAAPQYTINDFVGSWKASSFIHTSNTDPDLTVDLVDIGGEVRFTVLNGGGVRTWVEIDTFTDEWDAKATISGDQITSTPEEPARGVNVFTFEYDGTTLRMTNTDDTFQFVPGTEVETTSVGLFERQ